ncbi:EF hand [Sphingomonas sp. EC-HK361]|jgi:hypothetical protein|uniref:EF-hand domain-containing protein n=1 Tax=Sphingomonas sp. EC-HK361 TaxID=2038397 RepID=UPI001259DF6A|nr:EF-hand domain-containing protein [Sphingomonas sp. EC-HK361]VVT06323.1 EF hand [Sphingomonas sp. EC-HK361]
MLNVRGGAPMIVAALMVAACSGKGEDHADNIAAVSNYIPPSVTSRLDFGSSIERRFQALDRNADGKITKDELPRQDSRLARLDKNGDGVISADEFSKGLLARFDSWDLNKDGSVTTEERRRAEAQQATGENSAAPANSNAPSR